MPAKSSSDNAQISWDRKNLIRGLTASWFHQIVRHQNGGSYLWITAHGWKPSTAQLGSSSRPQQHILCVADEIHPMVLWFSLSYSDVFFYSSCCSARFNIFTKLIQHWKKLIQHFLNKCLNRIIYMLKWYIKNVELLYSNVGIIIQIIQITFGPHFVTLILTNTMFQSNFKLIVQFKRKDQLKFGICLDLYSTSHHSLCATWALRCMLACAGRECTHPRVDLLLVLETFTLNQTMHKCCTNLIHLKIGRSFSSGRWIGSQIKTLQSWRS